MGKTILLFVLGLAVPAGLEIMWLKKAAAELASSSAEASEVAIASAAEDDYCSPKLKQVLRRVAGACGLVEGGGRGCKPTDAKAVASLSGDDFNTLFLPLSHRVSILQFDPEVVDLDDPAKALVDQAWADQRGASFFFVVSRASADGAAAMNQRLSQQRAEAVLTHLEQKFKDPDLKKQVGLLWLGEEYAQLSDEFCKWSRSREGGACTAKEINRSAFVAWIDCAI
jgi:hypothetical protein